MGARVDQLMVVLAASRRPLSKEDGRRAEELLKALFTDWALVRDPLEAVLLAEDVVRRAHWRMGLAGWRFNDSVLDEVQRVLYGNAIGRRSLAWGTYGQFLGKWIRTKKAINTPENSILRALVGEAERMAPLVHGKPGD